MPRALISVSDKRGIVRLRAGAGGPRVGDRLDRWHRGGAPRGRASPVSDVEEVTGFPEMLDGRVKTLHPAVHGALLARRDPPEHMPPLEEHGITPIDLVAVNLYPFQRRSRSRA